MNTWTRDDVSICTDPERLDLDVIHTFLRDAYWSPGIPREVVERAIRHSLCFGMYSQGRQIGFARVITDRATYAYLADVFVLPEYRGTGLGTWLIQTIMSHPELQGLRRWSLLTRDAQELYARFGFVSLPFPERYMERVDPGIYRRATTDLTD